MQKVPLRKNKYRSILAWSTGIIFSYFLLSSFLFDCSVKHYYLKLFKQNQNSFYLHIVWFLSLANVSHFSHSSLGAHGVVSATSPPLRGTIPPVAPGAFDDLTWAPGLSGGAFEKLHWHWTCLWIPAPAKWTMIPTPTAIVIASRASTNPVVVRT